MSLDCGIIVAMEGLGLICSLQNMLRGPDASSGIFASNSAENSLYRRGRVALQGAGEVIQK